MSALVVASLVFTMTPPPPAKCSGLMNTFPGYEPGAPVVVVDDRVLSGQEGLEGIREFDVAAIEISCWNPETGEFGVPPGIPVVRVITRVACPSPAAEVCDWRSENQSAALRRAYDAAGAGPLVKVHVEEPNDLTDLGAFSEAAVYSSVLLVIRESMAATSRMLLNPTASAVRPDAPLLSAIPGDGDLADAFLAANETGNRLLPADADELNIPLFDRAVVRASADFWSSVFDRYGAGIRIVRLHRPGFSADGNTAVIYYGWGCGGRCGETHIAILARESGRWGVVSDELLMIS